MAKEPAAATSGSPALGPGAALPVPPPASPLLRKLGWILLFRLALVTVLLGGTAAWQVSDGGGSPLASVLYRFVATTYGVSVGFGIWLATRRALPALAWIQVAGDVLLATAVVAVTGFADSVFVFMYSLAIVEGGILLFQRGAVVTLGATLLLYLPLAMLAAPVRPPLLSLFAHAGAFVATAALASYLSEQVRRTGERLAARELDLAAITALHESIVQSVASGLLTVDAHGRVTFLNRAGEQITGRALSDVRGRPADRWFAAFQAAAGRDETDFVNAGGETLRLGYSLFPLLGREGVPIGRAVIFQDLTQLRAMEERVQRSERLVEMGRVAAGLAHELRNPIAAMSGSIELLRSTVKPTAEEARLMDIVLREASRLEQLVTRFLEYARPAVPQRAAVDLSRVVGETLEVFANDPAAAQVRVERAVAPTPAWCDADQIRQVLWNLLVNAAQASGRAGGGRVWVHCAPEPDGGAIVEVEDDGPGIAAQDLPRVFTPFFTTKERGTGLGLATVQSIVDAHHGTVAAVTGAQGGARFVVRLPPHAPPPG
ncbi:MAG TPA: ATP-binding protein [Anaeromyxobacteraceae bacterium]|nr:ATP-binding protein [Anaeromyxobacteraceae bacterium]